MNVKPNKGKRFPWTRIAGGLVIGGVLGGLYSVLIGCRTGTCPITSHPLYSMLYGAVLGGIWFLPTSDKTKTTNPQSKSVE
ncbi:MAG: hypothetical protein D6762_01980 [Candidatus Neomarinimicrobiota bacterium]|nr:MAG: hypothetical protein D6762_01980 [Candidatus Neomarinimicrobiota bacterium]